MKTYLFPGQGSQIKGMGGTLFDEFSELTEIADEVLGYSIKALCLDDVDGVLNQTQYTQPALYVVNALSYQQKLKEKGNKPDFFAGHSLGEYNALQAAGALSFEDGLKLVQKRGELMSQATKGAMAAVIGLTENEIVQCLHDNECDAIDIANYNASNQTIISGLQVDLEKAQAVFQEANAVFIPLNTSGAFHSRYMKPAKEAFEGYLEGFTFSSLQTPVISNVYAEPYQQDQIAINLANQIDHSVRWSQSMEYLLDQGEMEFEELGVGDVLTKLITTIRRQVTETKQNEEKEESIEPQAIEEKEMAEQPPVESATTNETAEPDITTVANRAGLEKDQTALNKSIEDWNSNYPVGTKVTIEGYEKELETRTRAMILFGHKAALYVKGYNGYFVLDEVTPVGEYA